MSNPTPTPEPVTINASRALRMVQDAVKTRGPDYNYKLDPERFPPDEQDKSCMYVRNGQADCLVGVALTLEGMPVESLAAVEEETYTLEADEDHDCEVEGCVPGGHATSINNAWFLERLREKTGFVLTPEAVEVFAAAQVYQDTARTWGEAEAAAAKTKEQGYREPLPNGSFGG